MNAKYGLNLSGAPKLNDPDFVYQLVFDPARGAREPKARFAYLFPSADSALVSVRLKAGLSDAERARAVALVRAAVRMPEWRLDSGGRYVVTGVPVLAGDLTDELAGSTLRLLLVAVAVMALVLALLFRARLRLLPLGLALGAVSIVFGAPRAARAAADDGLDRGAAGAARPGRRLRDPVPGARRAARCRRSPPRRWRAASASSCCCSRRCRWCAGSGRCSSWAWASRSCWR